MYLPTHLRTETHSVSETTCFLFSRIPDDGKVQNPVILTVGVSFYTAETFPAVTLSSDFVQVTNMRTYKRKTERGTMNSEMYMEGAKQVSDKA
jgi:hypothetical protein